MRGQSSIEFLSLVSMSGILLAALYGLVLNKQATLSNTRSIERAESVASEASFQVEMALVQGEGYSRTFSLPESLDGSSYSVSVGRGTSLVETEDSNYTRPSRYQGRWVNLSTGAGSAFRVVNNGSIYIVPE